MLHTVIMLIHGFIEAEINYFTGRSMSNFSSDIIVAMLISWIISQPLKVTNRGRYYRFAVVFSALFFSNLKK